MIRCPRNHRIMRPAETFECQIETHEVFRCSMRLGRSVCNWTYTSPPIRPPCYGEDEK